MQERDTPMNTTFHQHSFLQLPRLKLPNHNRQFLPHIYSFRNSNHQMQTLKLICLFGFFLSLSLHLSHQTQIKRESSRMLRARRPELGGVEFYFMFLAEDDWILPSSWNSGILDVAVLCRPVVWRHESFQTTEVGVGE